MMMTKKKKKKKGDGGKKTEKTEDDGKVSKEVIHSLSGCCAGEGCSGFFLRKKNVLFRI